MAVPAFETERELQAVLADHASVLGVHGAQIRTRREMPMGASIPDLMLVSFDRIPAQSIVRVRWSYPHAFVISELRRVAILHRDTITRRMFERRERVDRLIDELIDAGALEETTSGSVRLAAELRSLDSQVVAVEAKLSRWTDALEQAISYAPFADRSIVAMDAGRIDVGRADLTQAFRRAGIGLVLVGSEGARCVHKGRRNDRATPGKDYVRLSAASERTQMLWMRR